MPGIDWDRNRHGCVVHDRSLRSLRSSSNAGNRPSHLPEHDSLAADGGTACRIYSGTTSFADQPDDRFAQQLRRIQDGSVEPQILGSARDDKGDGGALSKLRFLWELLTKAPLSALSSRAKPRDLRFCGPSVFLPGWPMFSVKPWDPVMLVLATLALGLAALLALALPAWRSAGVEPMVVPRNEG